MKHGWKDSEIKPIAMINTSTNMIKFYNSDGSRNTSHSDGFFNKKDINFYKANYLVKFIT